MDMQVSDLRGSSSSARKRYNGEKNKNNKRAFIDHVSLHCLSDACYERCQYLTNQFTVLSINQLGDHKIEIKFWHYSVSQYCPSCPYIMHTTRRHTWYSLGTRATSSSYSPNHPKCKELARARAGAGWLVEVVNPGISLVPTGPRALSVFRRQI